MVKLTSYSLHLNLIEHLNAEIGLGTVTDVHSAKKWLSGTFLYVRLKDNPDHYKIKGDIAGRDLEQRLEQICSKNIALLEENDLVSMTPKMRATEFGDAMARYYVDFDTMKIIMALPAKAKLSEIVRRAKSDYSVLRILTSTAFCPGFGTRIPRPAHTQLGEAIVQGTEQIPVHSLPDTGGPCHACSQSIIDYPISPWRHRLSLTGSEDSNAVQYRYCYRLSARASVGSLYH